MKVLVADKFEESGLDGVKHLGAEVLYEPELKDDALDGRVSSSGAEILVVRSTKVTEPMMEGSRLKLIIRAGAGYNTIDVAAATARGILVANCPGKNAAAVAELAFGLMIAADRKIPDNVAELRAGRWNKKRFSQARGLAGRTLGLIGMGSISAHMVPRAQAFDMHVTVFSRWMAPEDATGIGVRKAATLADLAHQSDFVSVHVSLTAETRGMLGPEFFSSMREGAVFVNTSRAEVVDQAALLKAVRERGIVAGLDVFEGEPAAAEAEYEGELRTAEGVYCTHHIGASTEQAQEAVASEVVRIVREFQATGVAPNVVSAK
jgi:D-3-phosphoglycerate dehydrogenase / 2-oxoglutarate reductase